jgi:hypothetical protein
VFRAFGQLAKCAPHGEIGSINDKLSRGTGALLDGSGSGSRGVSEKADYEEAKNSWPSHIEQPLKSGLGQASGKRPTIFLFQRN